MIGHTISHYTVLEKLGAGGMGEIYKAQDTRLNRFVAIKVLSGSSAGDPERRRRFIQEAQAASALNHPNIITIYDALTQDGMDLMVMEFVSGSTLDALIPKEGMSAGKALDCAVQMASALEAAHSAGIVHRDLKPGNVMVTNTGLVKILDFGLAKLTAAPMAVKENDATLPISAPMTMEGSILGTVSYMSPEQADARPVDARSDIFTFGVVLYEMLTGHKAFAAGSTVSTLSAILRDDPKPIDEFVESVPAELDEVVRRSMKKDPAERYQNMGEVRAELAALKQRSDSAVLKRPAVAAARKKPPLVLILGAAGVLVVAAAAAGFWLTHRPVKKAPPPPVAQVVQPPAPPVQAPAPPPPEATVPPDDSVLTNQGVLDMLDAKVPNAIIVAHVRSSKETKFDLSTSEIIKLTKAGASGELLETMRNPKVSHGASAAKPKTAPVEVAPAPNPAPVTPPQPAAKQVAPAPVVAPPAPPKAAPAPVVPAAPKAVTINVANDLPLGISLTEDVPNDPPEGQVLHFVVARDFRVNDTVVVAKGTPLVGQVAGAGKRKLLVVHGKATFKLSEVDTADGGKLKIRATEAAKVGKEDRVIEPPGRKDKKVLAPAGTQYVVFVDGNQTVTVRH